MQVDWMAEEHAKYESCFGLVFLHGSIGVPSFDRSAGLRFIPSINRVDAKTLGSPRASLDRSCGAVLVLVSSDIVSCRRNYS